MAMTLQTTPECCSTSLEVLSEDRVICRCLSVTESEAQTAISAFNVQTVRELGRCTGAGKGCMACHGRLRALIKAQMGQ
ncbi:MAG: (2Fe-2S)-binding protein [Planctomycetota bacterium]